MDNSPLDPWKGADVCNTASIPKTATPSPRWASAACVSPSAAAKVRNNHQSTKQLKGKCLIYGQNIIAILSVSENSMSLSHLSFEPKFEQGV